MLRRLAGVLTGFLLLSTGGYFSWRVVEGWQNQPSAQYPAAAATPAADRASSDAPAPDPNDVTNIHPAAQVESVFGNLFSPAHAPAAQANPTSVPPSSSPRSSAAIDHVTTPLKDPTARVRERFAVRTYQGFLFIVPPRTIHPELHGSFRSMVAGHGALPSGHRANIQLLLLNQQEFDNFAHGREETATFTNDPSDGGRVDWALASPMFEAQKYYLIFRNSPQASSTKIVDADFTLSFE
jgi:hypothetical protein